MDPFASENRRKLVLKRGKERMISKRHPWIFAGAIGAESGPSEAAIADLVDEQETLLASGFYSSPSQIRLRALTFGSERISAQLIRSRLQTALARRRGILNERTNAARMVHGDGDELSALIVDRYADMLVVEIANRGLEQISPLITEVLQQELAPRLIYFQNDLPVRKLEGLSMDARQIGDGLPEGVIVEHGLRFRVDVRAGQKTGFFLDQRENRELCRTLAADRTVLNLFSYSGGFGVYAAAGGAIAVENVDISAPAIELARANHELNGTAERARCTVADVFELVRARAAGGERVDLLVCDPPAFAKSRGEVERAARGYKDVNLYAMRLVQSGGLMMTFSCSGHMGLDLFQKVIFAAALDAGRRVAILDRLTAGPDHPVSLYCPEGEYLKGFLLRIEN